MFYSAKALLIAMFNEYHALQVVFCLRGIMNYPSLSIFTAFILAYYFLNVDKFSVLAANC